MAEHDTKPLCDKMKGSMPAWSITWPLYVTIACSSVAVLSLVLTLPALTMDVKTLEAKVKFESDSAKALGNSIWGDLMHIRQSVPAHKSRLARQVSEYSEKSLTNKLYHKDSTKSSTFYAATATKWCLRCTATERDNARLWCYASDTGESLRFDFFSFSKRQFNNRCHNIAATRANDACHRCNAATTAASDKSTKWCQYTCTRHVNTSA